MRCYVVTLWFIVSHFIYLSRLEELKREIETPREDKQQTVVAVFLHAQRSSRYRSYFMLVYRCNVANSFPKPYCVGPQPKEIIQRNFGLGHKFRCFYLSKTAMNAIIGK